MVQADLTRLSFADGTFDVVLASNVLEHIPDDRAAMGEVRRVLRPGGWAMLPVPIAGLVTCEDVAVTDPAERERLFGQSDHVRVYGEDFHDRLAASGFIVARLRSPLQAMPSIVRKLGLPRDEEITLCTRA